MPRNKFFIVLFLYLACAARIGFAGQDGSKDPDYSKESSIVTSTETHLHFAADGTSVRTQTTSIKVLSEAGVHTWGVLAFGYASENEHVDVHFVRVHKADGSTVATPPENVLDLPSEVTRVAPMYSDLKQKQIPVKALGVGDTLEFEIAYVEDKPLVPGQFWYSYSFTRDAVVLKEILELRVPRDKQPRIANADLKPVITEDGAEKVYTWTTSNTEPTKPTGTDVDTDDKKKASVQFSTFTSWQQMGGWYSKLAQPQVIVTPEIQAKADALVKDIPAGAARIEALYDFVSTHIRYISLSFGIGRLRPHAAGEVLENEYGDCKDKHTLLAALLKAEGIDAWPVLINSSQKLDEEVPSPGQFDHVITVIPQGKQYQWLDTTPEVAPYGMLMSVLRDKQALVMPPSAAAYLMKTPADPPFLSEDHLVMRGDLNSEGTFKGHGELTLRGDSEVIYREIFHYSARAKWQDVMQLISYRLGFAGEVSNVQIDDPDATRKPFHLIWDYERKKYGDWENRKILPPTGSIPINSINEEKEPKSPIKVGFPGTTIYTAELTLPPGSSMEAPANVDFKTEFAEYHAKYSIANGRFMTERRLIVLKQEVPIADWRKYVAFQKELEEDCNFMSTVITSGAEAPATSGKDNQDANALMQKAWEDLQEGRLDGGEDTLDKVRKLNPHQTNLNADYGYVYLRRGKIEEALDAYRTELKEHPDNLRIARWFAQLLIRMKRDDEAIGVYETVLKITPDDVDATSELAHLLVDEQRWNDAQPVVEKAIKLRPDNVQVQIWYGQSCLHSGKEADGLAALKSAAEATDDPAMLSTIASALADAGKAPDVAVSAAHRAVTIIEEQTSRLSLESITNGQIKKMTDLAQVWDRMSWAAFKAGDLPLAEKYALAAWMLAQDPSAGDHLGQIYEKEGNAVLALDAYKLAKARGYPPVPGIDDRINALEKRTGHVNSKSNTSADQLQNLRIIHLARAKSLSASADFLILFAGGTVSDVKMLGGDPAMETYVNLLKQTKFNMTFPDAGLEHVVRQGILSCSVYDPNCMFMMMLPADATTYSRTGIPLFPSAGNGSTIMTVTKYVNDPKAAKLIAAGRLSIQHREFEAAQSQLDEARSLNPDQARLWTNYGYLEFQRGNMSAAIPDYRKELALYPDNYGTYSSLAEAQNILGQEKEAQETLRQWASAQPDNVAPITALVSMLIDEGHFSEALSAAKAGIAHLPEMSKSDQRLQLLIGRAQITAGMQRQGETTLLDILHTTTDPGMMNDAAYELGKAGLDLPLVETIARDALDKLTAESKTWNLQENVPNSLAKSRRIAATWDTLGWILYRQGKIPEAEGYIQPAWADRATAEIGEHLAEIAEAKGNREEALRLWELALATYPNYLRPSVRKTPGATQLEIIEHIETLRKAGAKESSEDADKTLEQLRTVDLGPSNGLTGSAEYRLLLSNGAVLDLQKTGEKEVPAARERIKAAKFPSYWPKGSEAQLVRNAMLNCHAGICELVFEP